MKHLRNWLLLAACVPYLAKLPYMFRAWSGSPLDRWDWLFPVLAAIAAFPQLPRVRRMRPTQWDWYALTVVLPAAAGVVFFHWFMDVNALEIGCAILFWWGCIWLCRSWEAAFALVPAFGILLLGVTSSTYWICFFLSFQLLGGLVLKGVAAALLLLWSELMLRFRMRMRAGTLLFLIAVPVAALLLFHARALNERSPELVLALDKMNLENYVGRMLPQSEGAQRFFRNSAARSVVFADDNRSFHVLEVRCGKDIHEIHPASHCLRTSGARILAEYPVEIELGGGQRYRVTEIQADIRGVPALVFVWYTSSEWSTGGFLAFRKAWSPEVLWRTYQVSTPILVGVDEARECLTAFVAALHSKRN